MLPGDQEVFPINQQWSVVNTYTTRMTKEKIDGWSFSYNNDYKKGITTITRVK